MEKNGYGRTSGMVTDEPFMYEGFIITPREDTFVVEAPTGGQFQVVEELCDLE
jgi:hypothetical protein